MHKETNQPKNDIPDTGKYTVHSQNYQLWYKELSEYTDVRMLVYNIYINFYIKNSLDIKK